MTTPIKYDVTVGVEEAKRALADFEAALKKSDNAALRLDTDIARLELQAAELSAAIKTGGANAKAYALELHRVTDAIAGAKGLAPATGHAASRMLILGQFVDDAQYGLRGVVNNMPQVVQAFGGAAGLAGGIGIAAVALSQLHEHVWVPYDKAVKENAANMKLWRGQAERTGEAIRKELVKPVDELTQALKDAGDELDQLKYGDNVEVVVASQALIAMQTRKVIRDQNLERERAQLDAMEEEAKRTRYGGGEKGREQLATQRELVASIEKNAAVANKAIADQAERLGELTERNDRIREERARQQAIKDAKDAADKAAKEAERRKKTEKKEETDTITAYEKGQQALRDAIDRENAKRIEAEERAYMDRVSRRRKPTEDMLAFGGEGFSLDKIAEAARKHKATSDALALQEQKAWANEMASTFNVIGDAAYEAFTSPLSAVGMLLDAAAKVAGDKITLTGAEMIAGGTAKLFTPAAAEGLSEIGSGLAIVAAGQAIRVGGAAAVSALTGASSGGSAASGGRDPGAAPRRSSGGTGGDGSLTVNVSYGVAGPLPEDTARAIAAAVKTGDRRRGGR